MVRELPEKQYFEGGGGASSRQVSWVSGFEHGGEDVAPRGTGGRASNLCASRVNGRVRADEGGPRGLTPRAGPRLSKLGYQVLSLGWAKHEKWRLREKRDRGHRGS